jgi:FkbM family methyltransferase
MARFYTDLTRSWVVNRLRLGVWYYLRRFPIFGGCAENCSVTIKQPLAERDYQLTIEDQQDAIQALSIFRDENRWNQFDPGFIPEVVVDLGANRGFSTLFWRARFPHAQVHGVEMNAGNIERCRRLFADNRLDGVFHAVAIGDRNGTLSFRPHSSHTRHRLANLISEAEQAEDYDDETVQVPCLTISSFFEEAKLEKVDLMKVDIEGAEQFLLETLEDWGSRVGLILLEIHHNIDCDWALRRLKEAGFEVDLGDARNRTEWWCRRRQ